jgi:hypothetical protein
MERRPDIGLDSYDRLFPNQDTMPHGGFGNLLALPLQRAARKQDNTVFLDGTFVPWADQWAFLASVRKMGRPQIEEIVEDAERRGRVLGVRLPPQDDGESEPWTAPASRQHPNGQTTRAGGPARREAPIVGDLPATLELVLGNQIYIPKQGLHPGLRNRLLRLAAFQNPEFYKAQAMRLSTYSKPRVIACAEDLPHHIGLPRGCRDDVRKMLTDWASGWSFATNATTVFPDVKFHGDCGENENPAAVCCCQRLGGYHRIWQDRRRRSAHRSGAASTRSC